MKHPDTLDARMWNHAQHAPAWMQRIASNIAAEHNRTPPRVALVQTSDRYVWGGRYFHNQVAIAVYDCRDQEKNKACLVHELGHWYEDKVRRPGDELGRHSPRFYETLESLYRTHRFTLAYAKTIEVQYIPPSWEKRHKW